MDSVIFEDLRNTFGLEVTGMTAVDGGWLNRKWKVRTQRGDVLVKQFSRKRFGERQLEQIEDALVRQRVAGEAGVPCPAILHAPDGRPMRFLEDGAGTVYMVMTFCEGHSETPETVTGEQMRSLGETCGKMHRVFSQLPVTGVKGYPIDSARLIRELRENYSAWMNDPAPSTEYRAAAAAQKPILDSLSADFFDRLPKGIAHEDFSPDNILFNARGVTAVLDFDRSCFSFRYHDIGRALMSLAWDRQTGTLDLPKIRAFTDGYALHMPLSAADLPDILRITWCIEAPWWIRPEFFTECAPKVARFRDELLWLTEHWFDLDRPDRITAL